MKTCNKCNKPIERSSHANNVKYCAQCRIDAYKYTEYRSSWQRLKRGREALHDIKNKIQCLVCLKYYKKPISHAWQVHGIQHKEYKDRYGLDRGRGIIIDSTREVLQEYVKENYSTVVEDNLLKKGIKTRYKKGDPDLGRYQRSEQTKERLKQNRFL